MSININGYYRPTEEWNKGRRRGKKKQSQVQEEVHDRTKKDPSFFSDMCVCVCVVVFPDDEENLLANDKELEPGTRERGKKRIIFYQKIFVVGKHPVLIMANAVCCDFFFFFDWRIETREKW